jgi:hypothetical protein
VKGFGSEHLSSEWLLEKAGQVALAITRSIDTLPDQHHACPSYTCRALQQQQGHSPALRLGSTSMSAQSGTHASGEGGAHHQHQQQHLTTRSTSVTASQAGAGGVEPRQDSTSVPGSRKGAFSKLMGSLRKGRSKDE